MLLRLLTATLIFVLSGVSMVTRAADGEDMASPAQESSPPSAEKLVLIHRFMIATGLQGDIDSGSFLYYLALPGGPLAVEKGKNSEAIVPLHSLYEPIMKGRFKQAYEKYRPDFQREYEEHINWEFSEAELVQILTFLESPVGKHYLDGSWRMQAYVSTNIEPIIEQLVAEARSGQAMP